MCCNKTLKEQLREAFQNNINDKENSWGHPEASGRKNNRMDKMDK